MVLAAAAGNPEVSATYVELGVEQNQMSVIRPLAGAGNQVGVDTPDILSCNEFRTFWIYWTYQSVIVGSGSDITEGSFLVYSSESMHYTQAVGFVNSPGIKAEYEFVTLSGKICYC